MKRQPRTPSSAAIHALPLDTADGALRALYSGAGLIGLGFPSGAVSSARASEPAPPAAVLRWHRWTLQAVRAVLRGRRARRLPPLDISSGTEFQRRVWTELRRIPPGSTRSYGAIARRLGRAGAARAVGAACGANPIPLLIPCHRVLAAGGRLGGFSGGLPWKRRLLQREGVLPAG